MKIILALVLSFSLTYPVYAQQGARGLYAQARKAVKSDSIDFAFLYFNSIMDRYSDSKFADEALFSMGEYYFSNQDFYDANITFRRFVEKFPMFDAAPFAKMYLLKIARIKGNQELTGGLQRQIIDSEQLSLLFRDFKEYEYLSAFSNKYKAVYFIDRIQFFVNGQLFETINY